MTPITEDNIIRHELIGLQVSVVHSSNPTHIGIKGKVIDENKNMLMILNGGKKRWIQKDAAVYSFTLPDKSIVVVEGNVIVGKSVERIKKSSKRRVK